MTREGLTRRSFVKTASLAGAAAALSVGYTGKLAKVEQAWADDAESASTDSGRKTYVTTCRGCIQACPARVYVENGIVTKIEGHPYGPTSLGSLCMKGLNQLNNCYSPYRVLYPLKRSGARGAEEMAWERISWDEAIDLAATKIADAIEKYGTYSFFTSSGGGGSYSMRQAITMCHSLGSPTVFRARLRPVLPAALLYRPVHVRRHGPVHCRCGRAGALQGHCPSLVREDGHLGSDRR
ncbi:twin-arginine translocation signal domain-containing protein [Adlercreutzia caecimuris]|jgi:anaerobic selenocysteine-containing dehydrogenase|uniref:twin-arginine translocation signal domain-containing protein n=1 Tax=Adlercreutzia caecimuris TaxID=671266 RepID=UPI0024321D89|nr:twin-arginine translocation signal domain-containing protein [Adlercreutzia caecimuris]